MISRLQFNLLLLGILLQLTSNSISFGQAPCDSLLAPCTGTASWNGFYFDLVAGTSNTLIKSFSTISQNGGPRNVEIYYKIGTYAGFESNSSAWTLVGSATNFSPLTGLSCPIPATQIPIVANVCIPAGQRYAFYIIKTGGTGSFEAHTIIPEGLPAASDGSLILFAGKATSDFVAFQGSFLHDSATFQGSIDYSCGCTTGIHDAADSPLSIAYPVPAVDVINMDFNFSTSGEKTIYIFDVNGGLVKEEKKIVAQGKNKFSYDISRYVPGVYSVRVVDAGNQNSELIKTVFVKQ